MDCKVENGVLTLYLSGRVDSSNAAATEEDLFATYNANPHDSLVIDAENLEYISSAGLRIILRVRKADPSVKIINVNSEVYDIFDMTGFTEMIPIEKAYRRLSVEGCEAIGVGSNGKVYRLDPDTIIKVYFNADALPDIHRERELARKALVMGIPTAIPYDVVKVGDSYGSVFELLNAKSFSKLMVAEPENVDHYIDLYVDLLKKIHDTLLKPGDMPDMKQVALGWAKFLLDYLPEEDGKKLVSLVEAVPENHHMMHGDYHVKNIMMQNGEVLLIDMDTLCMGDPVFEFASIFLAYLGFSCLDHSIVKSFLGIEYDVAKRIWDRTLSLYFETEDPAKLDEIASKAMIIGYTRLMRRTIRRIGLDNEEGATMVEHCKNELHRLLAQVDSLSFAE